MTGRLCTLIVVACVCLGACAQTIQINKENRTIAVTATGEAEVEADLAEVSIGFDVYGADQTQTYADATRISNAIMDALRAAGIKADAIESRNQSLASLGDDDKLRYNKGIRFHFTQQWTVTVPAAAAAETIHAGVLAGANDSGNIQWKLKNADAVEEKAADKALARARQTAERLARGLGSRLGPLVYASDQVPQRGPFAGMLNTSSASVSMKSKVNLKPLAISPEKLSRSATVYAVFSIE